MPEHDYDVLVLGGGSAGTSAGQAASATGARVGIVNDGELGGLCILRGCMPTKAMLASSHALRETRRLGSLGVRLPAEARPDFAAIMERRAAQVARFKRAKVAAIERADYELIPGRARFAAGGGVEVVGPGRTRTLTARRYVIATGSIPHMLAIEGMDRVPVWTSDDVMRLTRQPRSLLVQGAGPVALELGQFFGDLGTDVLLVNRSRLLKHHDEDLGAELRAALEQGGMRIAAPGRIVRLEPDGGGVVAVVEHAGGTIEHRADALLMATGRVPALAGLGLEHTRVEVRGGTPVHDAHMRTADERIYVAGDAAGHDQVLHLANQEGRVAGHNAAAREPGWCVEYRLRMGAIFTDPPFAEVGRTQADCAREGIPCTTSSERFPETGRAITMGVEHGLWRVVAHAETGELLGSQCLGPRADDLVHTIAAIMYYRGTAQDLLGMPWYHPTLSEVLLSIARTLAPGRALRTGEHWRCA